MNVKSVMAFGAAVGLMALGSADAVEVSGDAVVADVLRVRMTERGIGSLQACLSSDGLKVGLVEDASLAGDDARIVCRGGGRATVRGARRRALMHGAGLLLRQMTWTDHGASMPDGEWEFRPLVPLRQTYFARQCHNVYYMWDDRHRHFSHLWAVYPGTEITMATPALFAAAKKSMSARGDEATGWSMGWKTCVWARLPDGEHAARILHNLFRPATEDRGRTARQPLRRASAVSDRRQLRRDGRYRRDAAAKPRDDGGRPDSRSASAGLAVMLPEGEVRGLCARGGRRMDIRWRDGRIVDRQITGPSGYVVRE